jgi:Fe-S-cluster containining protein
MMMRMRKTSHFCLILCLISVSRSSSEAHFGLPSAAFVLTIRQNVLVFRKRPTHCCSRASDKHDDDDDDSIRLAQALQRSSSSSSSKTTNDLPWYFQDNGKPLPFECTECGKCCQTKGSVYLSPAEIRNASALLQLSEGGFIEKFASHMTTNGSDDDVWIRLKNNKQGSCVFLHEDSKHCRIYEARPTQCSTYPFWPSIMKSRSTWNDEVRIPDNQEKSWTIPYWTADKGGCEGMQWISSSSNDNDDPNGGDSSDDQKAGVPVEEAHRQLLEYLRAETRFPRAKPISLGEQDSASSSKSTS